MEAVAVQAAVSLVAPAVEGGKRMFNYLKHKYGYVKNLSHNFMELEKEEKYLRDKEGDVKTQLDRNKLRMEKTHRCETWLSEVENIKGEIEKLKNEYKKTSESLCVLCPFPGLLKLGKQIVRKTRRIVDLKNQGGQIPIMVDKAPGPPAPSASPASLVPLIRKHAKKLDDVPSLNKHVETLLEWLRDDKLKRICIWGPPGVGKTTIMENLHDIVGESCQFDIIFWVTVTTEGGTKDIQQTVWKRLDLKVGGKYSSDQIADMISEELKNKSYVLFLDEVFSEINLKEVGIHDEHERGKVVFACRYNNICGHTDEDMNVRRLSEDDAEKLFWEIAGTHLKGNRDIKQVARLIINECGGMPNMIKLIGNSLANVDDPAIWRDTLFQLRSPSMEPQQELEEVYKSFKVVYDKLHGDKKPCLLYWAIFPIGYEISRDYIIECWRAEQFFTRLRKLGETRDRGHAILEEFVRKSLLEKGRKVGHFKMFEHFQRVALRIANVEGSLRFLVTEGEKIKEEEWQHANRVSLIRPRLSTLPKRPQCCGILTLLLQESSLTELPRSFFEYMRGLQVLDLHETRISSLPSSISSLINLKVLFLNNCSQLVQLPSEIGDLHSLEILDIRNTGIHSLPTEIGQLANLRCLRVTFEEDVGNHNHVEAELREMIPRNIVARLSLLEELTIVVNPNSRKWNQNANAVAREVAMLEELTTLCFYFPQVECFENFVLKSKSWNGNNTPWGGNSFRSFSIVVGYHQRNCSPEFDIFECSAEKHLRYAAGEGYPDAISHVLEQAHAFELIGHQYATNLSVFGADKLGGLEACVIEDCNEMESIVQGDVTGGVAFQCLKKLHIENLPKLVHIWEGSIESESLNRLTTLTLKGCHKINMLFSQRIVLQLRQLQYLQVEDCRLIEEIIEAGSMVDSGAFPKLKNLQLCDLPKLSCICQCVSLKWDSLENISIKTCKELKNLLSTKENVIKLRVIQCSEDWWNQQVWPNESVKDRFRSFLNFI